MKFLKKIIPFFLKKSYFSFENSLLYTIVLKKFFSKKINLFFTFFLALTIILSVLGYLICPDNSPYANHQNLEIALQKPGFSVTFLKIRNQKPKPQSIFKIMLFGKPLEHEYIPIYKYRFFKDSIEIETFTGMQPNDGIILKFSLKELIQNNEITTADNLKLKNYIEENNIEKRTFLLGTDRYGRDVLSQLIIGSRVSLSIGFIAVFISLLIGVTIGSLGGYFGGKIDKIVIWLINVVWSIPTLFLVIAITFALGRGFWQIFIAVGLTLWVDVARIVRGQFISLREKEYIEAARALGFSNLRIITKHILPAIFGPIIVITSANLATAILIESGLSFLGIGVQPPMPSWGNMLKENYGFLLMNYAYLPLAPGCAIVLLVLSFMILGNGLRDAMDVKEISSIV